MLNKAKGKTFVMILTFARVIDVIERTLISSCFTALLLLALGQIIARNVFDAGILWADDAIKVLVLWIAMLGALYATKLAKHINIDIASRFIPVAFGDYLKRMIAILTAGICFISAYHSAQFILLEIEDPLIAFLNVPTWMCEIVIPVALFGMGSRFALMALFKISNNERVS